MLLVELLLVEGGVGGEEGRRGERRLGHLARLLRRQLLLRLHHREAGGGGRDRRGRRVLGARLWGARERLELIHLKLKWPY